VRYNGDVGAQYDCATVSSCLEIAHLVRGRLRLRLARSSAGFFVRALALLSSQSGVTHVRGNQRCLSIAVRFDPERVTPQALIARLNGHLGVTNEQPNSARPRVAGIARARRAIILDLLLDLFDPPGIGFVRDVIAVLGIVRTALRELRVRPWPQVVLHSLARFVFECSLLDLLIPARIRLLLRLGRAALAIRATLLASFGTEGVVLAPLAPLAAAA
jgi:hypothetical protein